MQGIQMKGLLYGEYYYRCMSQIIIHGMLQVTTLRTFLYLNTLSAYC